MLRQLFVVIALSIGAVSKTSAAQETFAGLDHPCDPSFNRKVNICSTWYRHCGGDSDCDIVKNYCQLHGMGNKCSVKDDLNGRWEMCCKITNNDDVWILANHPNMKCRRTMHNNVFSCVKGANTFDFS